MLWLLCFQSFDTSIILSSTLTNPAFKTSNSSSSGFCTWVWRLWIQPNVQVPQIQNQRQDSRLWYRRVAPNPAKQTAPGRLRSKSSTADRSWTSTSGSSWTQPPLPNPTPRPQHSTSYWPHRGPLATAVRAPISPAHLSVPSALFSRPHASNLQSPVLLTGPWIAASGSHSSRSLSFPGFLVSSSRAQFPFSLSL